MDSASSSNGSNQVKFGMLSGITSRWTMRLQYLCSHFSSASSEAERVPNFSHSSGSMVETGKSM